MSGKLTGQVWDLDLPHPLAWVLMAYLDHADHEGRNIRPSIALIAWKTSYSPRQVSYLAQKLVAMGALVIEHPGGGRGNPTEYRANLAAIPQKPPRIRSTIQSVNHAVSAGFTETMQGEPQTRQNEPQNAEEPLTVNQNQDDIELWEKARAQLRLQMTKSTWETWIWHTEILSVDRAAHSVLLRAENSYARDWLTLRLRPMIKRTLASLTGQPCDVTITL